MLVDEGGIFRRVPLIAGRFILQRYFFNVYNFMLSIEKCRFSTTIQDQDILELAK
jgi:hypothetical protein